MREASQRLGNAARRVASPCMSPGQSLAATSVPSMQGEPNRAHGLPQQRAIAGTGLEAMRGGRDVTVNSGADTVPEHLQLAQQQQQQLQQQHLQQQLQQPMVIQQMQQQQQHQPGSVDTGVAGRMAMPMSPARSMIGHQSSQEAMFAEFEKNVSCSLNGRLAELEGKLSRSFDADLGQCRQVCTAAIMDFRQEMQELRQILNRQVEQQAHLSEKLTASQDDTFLSVIHDVRELRMAVAAVCTDVEQVQRRVADQEVVLEKVKQSVPSAAVLEDLRSTQREELQHILVDIDMLRAQNDTNFRNTDQLKEEVKDSFNTLQDQIIMDLKSLSSDVLQLQRESGSAIEALKEQQSSLESLSHCEAEALRKEQASAMYIIQGQMKKESDAIMAEINALEASRLKVIKDLESVRDLCTKSSDDLQSQLGDQGSAVEDLQKQHNTLLHAMQHQYDSRKSEIEELKKQHGEANQILMEQSSTLGERLRCALDELREYQSQEGMKHYKALEARCAEISSNLNERCEHLSQEGTIRYRAFEETHDQLRSDLNELREYQSQEGMKHRKALETRSTELSSKLNERCDHLSQEGTKHCRAIEERCGQLRCDLDELRKHQSQEGMQQCGAFETQYDQLRNDLDKLHEHVRQEGMKHCRALDAKYDQLRSDFEELREQNGSQEGVANAGTSQSAGLEVLRSEQVRALEVFKTQQSTFIQLMQDQHSRDLEELRSDLMSRTSVEIEALKTQQSTIAELVRCGSASTKQEKSSQHADTRWEQTVTCVELQSPCHVCLQQPQSQIEDMTMLRKQQFDIVEEAHKHKGEDIEVVRAELRQAFADNFTKGSQKSSDTPSGELSTVGSLTISPVCSSDAVSEKA